MLIKTTENTQNTQIEKKNIIKITLMSDIPLKLLIYKFSVKNKEF